MASGLKGEAVLGRIPLAECNRSDMGDSRAHIVVVVDQVEVGANLMGKWAMWEDMKDAVAQGRNVRSGNWLAEVDLVVSEVEVVSQEAGRTGFDATEGSDLSCCDPLDEVEVDCCMAIDWVDELLVMRSFSQCGIPWSCDSLRTAGGYDGPTLDDAPYKPTDGRVGSYPATSCRS
jgi:hypothetical protein